MIKLYVGQRGSGKTAQCVNDAQWFFKRGYDIYSNVPCWGYSPRPKGERLIKRIFSPYVKTLSYFIYAEDLTEKLKQTYENKRNALFILDESPVFFNSRSWKNTDMDIISALNMSRKTKVHLFITAQRYHLLDKQIRETADYIYMCEKQLIKPFRFFTCMVVLQEYFMESTKSIFLKKYIKKRKFVWEGSFKKIFKHYDTGQVILPRRFYEKFPDLFPDPEEVTIDVITTLAGVHDDTEPPL
jgi:hypothetical protein